MVSILPCKVFMLACYPRRDYGSRDFQERLQSECGSFFVLLSHVVLPNSQDECEPGVRFIWLHILVRPHFPCDKKKMERFTFA